MGCGGGARSTSLQPWFAYHVCTIHPRPITAPVPTPVSRVLLRACVRVCTRSTGPVNAGEKQQNDKAIDMQGRGENNHRDSLTCCYPPHPKSPQALFRPDASTVDTTTTPDDLKVEPRVPNTMILPPPPPPSAPRGVNGRRREPRTGPGGGSSALGRLAPLTRCE